MRILRTSRLLALTLLAATVAPASATAAEAPVTEQIIVRHRAGLDAAERADVRADAETSLERRMRLANTEVVAVEDGSRAQALDELRADPDVLWAAPNGRARITTNDPRWPDLYALRNQGLTGQRIDADIDAEQAWGVSRGAGVTVAVVDTGVQANHVDLAGRVDLTHAYDFVDLDTNPSDPHGHGTHVAGIVAATSDNNVGVVGIAPEATVMPVRVLDADGYGDWADIIDGFEWAAANGADIVNASIGGPYDPWIANAFRQVFTAHTGTLFVISAGNDGMSNEIGGSLPCYSGEANVLCVGASTNQDVRASYSNYGRTTVDVFAPGTGIVSTVPTNLYWSMNGTSMAAPYAAGTAALVVDAAGKTGADVATVLKDTVDRPVELASLAVSSGRINAARAVGALVDAPSRPVIASTSGDANMALLSMAKRESDINAYLVYKDGVHELTTASSGFGFGGLAAGTYTFTVVARNTSNQLSPASLPVTVRVTDRPSPVAPTTPTTPTATPTRPGTATVPVTTPPSPVSDVRLAKRRGHQYLVFRVARTARVTVTLARRSGSTYRRSASKTIRLTPGMQSLPVTSRLLGMRVPRGRWRVTVGTSTATAASVTFTKR